MRAQAESMLSDKQVGEAVIRPSHKGVDHIAVTWKVAEGIYQHIDVTEHDKPSDSELGRQLSINNSEFFSDLDELLVNHVGAVVRKLDTLMQHEKYRPEGQLDDYLNDQVRARPGSSAYGFSLDSERPGWAKLSFLSRPKASGGVVQTWPVKIKADAYKLFETEVPGMTELCNAFKMQYQTTLESQRQSAMTPHGSRTPGGMRTPAGSRTPGGGLSIRPPGYGTPQAHARGLGGGSTPMVRPPGYGGTPLALGQATPMRPFGMGNATPRPPGYGTPSSRPPMQYAMATPNPYASNPYAQVPMMPPPGAAPPPPPPPPPSGFRPPAAAGMNPERARMIAQGNNGYHNQ